MTNRVPSNRGLISGLAVKMLAGLQLLGELLGITQITAADFEAKLDAFNDAVSDFDAKRSANKAAYTVFHTQLQALGTWLQATRNILAGRFGNRWSTLWAQAGFSSNSTALPSRVQDKIALALRLATFLTNNPTYQVASMNVTAAQATTLRNATITAQDTQVNAEVNLENAKTTLQDAQAVLTGTMRALIRILSATLGKMDARWKAFGLNMPGSTSTPGKPVGLTATVDGRGNIVAQCQQLPLATSMLWRTLIVGAQEDYVLAARTSGPAAVIGNVAPGQTVRLLVQGSNDGLQGVASEPIMVSVPLPVTEPAAKPQAAAPASTLALGPAAAPASAPATNGNGNGAAVRARTRAA